MNGILPQYGCTACNFSIVAGWSHQAFGSYAYCRACAAFLMFHSRTSEWAPEPGEALRVRRFHNDRWRVTRGWLPPFTGPSYPSEEIYQEFLAAVLRDLVCPTCSAKGQITPHPEEDESCPACRAGKLVARGSIIP